MIHGCILMGGFIRLLLTNVDELEVDQGTT